MSNVRSLQMEYTPQETPRLLRRRGSFHRENEPFAADAFRDSFRPVLWEPARAPETLRFGAVGGRSSVDWMPYFDLSDGDSNWRVAVGWSGQWNANIAWDGETFQIDAGMEHFDAFLEPGEHLEFPSVILLRNTDGGRECAVNLWRRFVTAEIMMALDGAPPDTPVSSSTWGGRNEAEHLAKLRRLKEEKIPLDLYWIDAGWFAPESKDEFVPVWAENVGDWKFDPGAYPAELRNISAQAHADGRKLLLWFEPERVRTDRQLAKEHPEYLLTDGSADALLNLGNPAAWQHCFDTMSRIIADNQLDWFRVDFNFSPLPYWQSADSAGRKGITEIHYINGLYRFWRELRKKFPHLMIDNCASGGRRLDFELLRYSLPLWYSDMQCFNGFEPRYSLTHLAGMADYWPRFGGGVKNPEGGDTYNFRAAISHGATVHYDYSSGANAENYPFQWLRERLAEYETIRACYAGDFYELVPPTPEEFSWTVLQYDLPEEKRGLITVFRGERSPEIERLIAPRGLSPECSYLVSDMDNSFEPFRVSGAEWMKNGFALRIAKPRTAHFIQYHQVK